MAGETAISATDFGNLKGTNAADPTSAQDVATKSYTDTGDTNAKSRANHTGTQTANTISDFDTQVRTNRLDQMTAPTTAVSMGSQRIINQADPTAAQDSATKAYVDNALSSVASGQTLKGAVRVAATTNVNIASPGTTIDGVTMANGDWVLLTGQTTGSQNGPYVFNGSAAAMTRTTNWDSSAEAVLGSYWIVLQGSKGDTFALMSNDTAITLGTTTPAFVFIAQPTAAVNGYNATCPSVSSGGTWTVTHNLNSKAVLAMVARVASPYDFVRVRIERTTVNTLSILPDVAMNAGDWEVIVYKAV